MVDVRDHSKIPEKYRPYIARRQRQKAEMRSRTKQRHQAGLRQAKELADILKIEFGATKVALFGSMLSVNTIHMDSDIDLAVWDLPFSDYMPALCKLSSSAKGFAIDLVRIEEAQPSLKSYILEEGLVLDEKFPLSDDFIQGKQFVAIYNVLVGRTKKELERIEVQYAQAKSQIEVARKTDQVAYWMAVSLGLHGIYTGIEKVFQQIAREVDGEFSKRAGRWYKALLEQMATEVPNTRAAVIDEKTLQALTEYLSFRHVVRSNYAYQLEPKRIDANFQLFENCYGSLVEQLAKFCAFLSSID